MLNHFECRLNTLKQNVTQLLGVIGKEWFDSLPNTLEKLSQRWALTGIQPVQNMSWNFVATALQRNIHPVVLKIGCDKQLIQDEFRVLQYFNGNGAIQVLDIHSDENALLLEQAVPGFLLKAHYSNRDDAIPNYAEVMQRLVGNPLSENSFVHVRKWCEAIDRIQDSRIDPCFLEKAKVLRTQLLQSMTHEYLCHGDLHLENIIQSGSQWLAIDPKGVIGEMAFEVAAFDLVGENEIEEVATNPSKIVNRVVKLASILGLNYNRLLSWFFLRLMIAAQWLIEDNGNPNEVLARVRHIYPLIEVHLGDTNDHSITK